MKIGGLTSKNIVEAAVLYASYIVGKIIVDTVNKHVPMIGTNKYAPILTPALLAVLLGFVPVGGDLKKFVIFGMVFVMVANIYNMVIAGIINK